MDKNAKIGPKKCKNCAELEKKIALKLPESCGKILANLHQFGGDFD